MKLWLLLACKTAVPPASPVPHAPPPIVLVDAATDALVPPPFTLVEVRADGTVSVSGGKLPVLLPVAGDTHTAPELVAALDRSKINNPNGPAVLAADAKVDVLAVRQAIDSATHARFTTLYFATRSDPGDPPASMRGIRWGPNESRLIRLGARDKSLINAVIQRTMNQIRYCYQRELTKQPDLAGEITVKFVVSATGSVSKAEIKSSTMGSPAVESCLVERFLHFRFPEPKGDGIVIVSYPLIFRPG